MADDAPLLGPDDPPTFRVLDHDASSPFVLTCDHAGRRLPQVLGSLGVPESELARHIAWDIGAAGVTERLAKRLSAFAILQTYSRLVIDCNRPLDSATLIVSRSELTEIPGNYELSTAARAARIREVFRPYHERIEEELSARAARGQRTVFVAVHSFTPSYLGISRPWHCGVLFNRDRRLADALLELLRADTALCVGENEPYSVSDISDYGVVVYGERRNNLHVELEIRQDLIESEAGQIEWTERLAELLPRALQRFAG